MFIALVTSLVVLFYCCVTADILTKLLQQCFLIFIVVSWLYLGNSQVSVYRTIGPTLVFMNTILVLLLKSLMIEKKNFPASKTAAHGKICLLSEETLLKELNWYAYSSIFSVR